MKNVTARLANRLIQASRQRQQPGTAERQPDQAGKGQDFKSGRPDCRKPMELSLAFLILSLAMCGKRPFTRKINHAWI